MTLDIDFLSSGNFIFKNEEKTSFFSGSTKQKHSISDLKRPAPFFFPGVFRKGLFHYTYFLRYCILPFTEQSQKSLMSTQSKLLFVE